MLKQTFVVTLEIPSPFDRYFPRVEAQWMANMVRDGVEAKSVSFTGAVPFRIVVEKAGEASTASGQVREYSAAEFEKAVPEPAKTTEAVLVQ
jgi:hypothetical protein